MYRNLVALCILAALLGCGTKPRMEAKQPPKVHPPGEIDAAQRIREPCPIRLGFVGNYGMGDNSPAMEDSAALGVKVGPNNLNWVATHLDLAAFDARCVTPDTFPQIRKIQRLFTGLLRVNASALYEQEDHPGNVGGWKPEMAKWTLRDGNGAEVKHPEAGAHWMDFGSPEWAGHWLKQVEALARADSASGVLAEPIPVGNTLVEGKLQKYPTFTDRVNATSGWLAKVHHPDQFLLVVSDAKFDNLIGRATLPVAARRVEPQLSGRCWDEFDSLIDGVWAADWPQPHWLDVTVPEKEWEIQMEAAERAAFNDNIFIASCAYHNPDELEYGLACFLLAMHRQGRFCYQPMPILPGQSPSIGFSLAVLKAEYNKYQNYFDVPLGYAVQERHEIVVGGHSVWKRSFENGAVYVNSHDQENVTVPFGGKMIQINGEPTSGVILGPHSGIILTYPPKNQTKQISKQP